MPKQAVEVLQALLLSRRSEDWQPVLLQFQPLRHGFGAVGRRGPAPGLKPGDWSTAPGQSGRRPSALRGVEELHHAIAHTNETTGS